MTNLDEKKLDDLAERNVNRDFLDLIDADRSVRFFKLGYRQAFADQQKKIEKLEKAVELMRESLEISGRGITQFDGVDAMHSARQTLAEVDAILKEGEL